jgi:lipopolysaccharide/colanic/teichoic acid biosynthesis glycosyltransferase/NDP-sugar pyrophosphorylase family protein
MFMPAKGESGAVPPRVGAGTGGIVARTIGRAVILGGGHTTALFPLANLYSKLEFPLAGEPLLSHQARHLARFGVTEISVLTSPRSAESPLLRAFQDGEVEGVEGVTIGLVPDLGLRGTAGILSVMRPYLRDSPFLVVGGSVYPNGFDLEALVRRHLECRAGITAVVQETRAGDPGRGHVEVDSDGQALSFDPDPQPKDGRATLSFSGLYICDPLVLDFIRDEEYMDLKEQLIPKLCRSGVAIQTFRTDQPLRSIDTARDYHELNRDILQNGEFSRVCGEAKRQEIQNGVWVGRNVSIAPDARIIGPVVIGDDTVIGQGAEITGPLCLGHDCSVGEGVRIRECLVWNRVEIRPGVDVDTCIVAEGCTIRKRTNTERLVLIPRPRDDQSTRLPARKQSAPIPGLTFDDHRGARTWHFARGRVARVTKRLLDLSLAAGGMIVFAPFFALLAIIIKLDSRGPVVFRQERCGRAGKNFPMFKLRTMVTDAEELKQRLRAAEGNLVVDGPMFKMERDPRITRVGHFLRRTSLDEIPQLMNVLRGEMSLVGPRPLQRSEMQFSPGWRDTRFQVRPGITGLWQVYGRNSPAFHDWIRYDVKYVREWSLMLDFKILVATFIAPCRGR